MFAKIKSAYLNGITGVGVDVECDVSSYGLPSFSIVGLADNAIKESRERVKASLKNLDYHFFNHPVTINLAPADMKKDGSHFDLPVAVSILSASGIIENNLDEYLFLGELSLDGSLRAVNGILSMAEYAHDAGIKNIIVPEENMQEASLIPELKVYGFKNLSETIGFLRGDIQKEPFINNNMIDETLSIDYGIDFKDVKGQFAARRAAEVAASGMHNFIMIGSPGSGKTMIARRIPSILPPMTLKEALETTKIHSVAGLIKDSGSLINKRPFVSPHHTSSNIAIIGGGSKAKPGNVSIANSGILFLDEMLEFSRSVLEVLRQPLEDRFVTIARAGRTVTYPAKFMLVAAMNPCPCGYLGDSRKACTCTAHAIERYRAKLSGPMLDRIDLISYVEAVDYKDLMDLKEGESSADIRQRVMNAHKIQAERFKDEGILYNSEMSENMVRKYCQLDDNALKIMEQIMAKHNISARSYSKILKTSRTIADMNNSTKIERSHILEAFQMKLPDSAV
ncbi:MAG: YifB family Mg chelatase-like AAA ATPase [Mucispirillum sp.]|uniref:YifB family Mg chelatase-like AAA ATPase n=1 Tax=Candidatus Mucispirillum faecigallinarum TaxID=2838699 RepID=A0A9D2GUU5_9BACT|nr:YifB family Mg chelatase-like AAA ATPase [Mucispirillum sp.]HIZ89641.1 YifB family Mg chelatase-like AAA ATPase [Candidatus Mucispirillum faecigallinarum]